MRLLISLFAFCLLMITANSAYSGVMELGASYSIRQSTIDDDNYTKNESWTGSFAWYFFELSAIEISYTKGLATQSLKAASDPNALVYFAEVEMYGADLVVTLAKKSSFIQPFVRGGAVKIKKQIYRQDPITQAIDKYGERIDSVVPSYGAGIKLMVTETFSIKGSYDRWRSGSKDDKDTWDDAIKAGVSWYF